MLIEPRQQVTVKQQPGTQGPARVSTLRKMGFPRLVDAAPVIWRRPRKSHRKLYLLRTTSKLDVDMYRAGARALAVRCRAPARTRLRARLLATAAQVQPTAVGDIPPPASDYRPAASSVDSSGQMTRVLNDIASILENDIGGSGIWYDRVLNAKNDLTRPRRAKLACTLFLFA